MVAKLFGAGLAIGGVCTLEAEGGCVASGQHLGCQPVTQYTVHMGMSFASLGTLVSSSAKWGDKGIDLIALTACISLSPWHTVHMPVNAT